MQNLEKKRSFRLKNWDYGANGWYFVTINTKDRENYFGEISNGDLQMSEIGKIAKQYWHEIPLHFPFVKLDEFVTMPDHIHGIIVIDKGYEDNRSFSSTVLEVRSVAPQDQIVAPQNLAGLQSANRFGSQSKNFPSIIRGFKAAVKKYATMNQIDFHWQPRYFDHIIRNEESLGHVKEYIYSNPIKWERGKG